MFLLSCILSLLQFSWNFQVPYTLHVLTFTIVASFENLILKNFKKKNSRKELRSLQLHGDARQKVTLIKCHTGCKTFCAIFYECGKNFCTKFSVFKVVWFFTLYLLTNKNIFENYLHSGWPSIFYKTYKFLYA